MATQNRAASVQGAVIRVTRLDAAGNLMTGPLDSYTMNAFLRVTFTPEYEEGDEFTEKGADGLICITYKSIDTLKRLTMEIGICEPDPELSSLLSGGLLLTRQSVPGDASTAKSVGWAGPRVGENAAGNGVAVEAWSYAVAAGKRVAAGQGGQYFHWTFPYVLLRQSGDRVIENGMLATTFSGQGLGNINFGEGPDGRWEWPSTQDRPYSYARTDYAPLNYNGFVQWNPLTGVGTPVTHITDPASFTNVPSDAGYNPSASFDDVLAAEDDTDAS